MSPPEVLDQILSYLQDDFTSLLTCTLASSTLCPIAHRYIYRSIELGPRGTKKPNRQHDLLLLRTLKTSTYDYGTLIHRLTLDGNPEDLLEMAPHLTNLKSLTLRSTRCMYIRTLPSYPDPLIVIINKIVSQPGFASLDIENYQLEGGVADLQYILEGANDLKHLGLNCIADTRSLLPRKPVISPPRSRTTPISLESLTLGFRQIRLSATSKGPVSHPVLRWLGGVDCVINVEKVRRLKMMNAGWYKVVDVVTKFMNTLEGLEMVEKEEEKIPEFIIVFGHGLGDLVAKRITFNQWFTSGYFPNLRHISLSTIPVDKHCVRGSTPLGIPWMSSMLECVDRIAPDLRTLSLKFHGQFQLPLTPLSQDSLSSSENEYDKHYCMHTVNYNYDSDELPLKKTMEQWNLLCGGNIKRCANLEQLNISFVEGKMLGDLDKLATMRRWMYADMSKTCISRLSDFPEERIKVVLQDSSGALMTEAPKMTLSREEFDAIRNGSGNGADVTAVDNYRTFNVGSFRSMSVITVILMPVTLD